jgi:hypothetical protein
VHLGGVLFRAGRGFVFFGHGLLFLFISGSKQRLVRRPNPKFHAFCNDQTPEDRGFAAWGMGFFTRLKCAWASPRT